jgi:outer membrane receptor protein involved in Fe transport
MRARLMIGAAVSALVISASPALAQEAPRIELAPQSLASALYEFGRQTGHQVIFSPDLTKAKMTQGVSGALDEQVAMAQLLTGTGLTFRHEGNTFMIVRADADPQSGSAAGDGADQGTVQALIVTAQKREEDIQDVPIAISAFTQEDLTRSQIAGGPDLMTQVPNFTFTKTNFSGYSIQIRGIGTQAVSATVDPAVAVAFNNTPFTRNRFFEQEFYDLERVEVLRGPQGTLYGRNATAGVVNIISAKPKFFFEAKASGDVGNFNSHRIEGMVNLPVVEDKVALRLAGAWTKRDGYAENQLTGSPIDGRDLWSTRATLRIDPSERLSANLIYEHFEEDDDRLRSGKQLCKRNPNPTHYGTSELPVEDGDGGAFLVSTYTSQGCEAASLYSPDSFQAPNGWALPYYGPIQNYGGFPAALGGDPYVSATQSRDLRVIESTLTPVYKAKTDITEFQLSYDVTSDLTLTSETAYSDDEVYSFQDFNRFTTRPGAWRLDPDMIASGRMEPNGQFCDPQLGCSDRLLAGDLSTGRSNQFSEELRLASSFDGPFNFSLGANFMRSDSVDKYYVFFNSLTLMSTVPDGTGDEWLSQPYVAGQYDGTWCLGDLVTSDPNGAYGGLPFGCKYIDPNPIGSLNDLGRNYFLSKNPYKLLSYAVFGEANYQIAPTLKVTAGLRWTVDKKRAPVVPIWLLADDTFGLPVSKVVRQEWREPTGRLVLDWTPDLPFTEQTLFYASYSRGYKAGGANPPLPVNIFGTFGDTTVQDAIASLHPPTFGPEFVNAYELGAKNTLLDGRLTANATAFYYDYTGYQISQIMDRSAVNLNFDAEVWGAELEIDWRPVENLRLGFKGGYEKTRMADGSSAIDLIDRTAGHTDWAVVKPFPTIPSNCILPVWWLEFMAAHDSLGSVFYEGVCDAYYSNIDPLTKLPYVANPTVSNGRNIPAGYPGYDPSTAPNTGLGFSKDLSGNELPNTPDFTATLTADYTVPLPHDWLATLHGDFYYQSEAWTRVFNTPGYDKLKAYSNVNVAAIFSNEDAGWRVMAYVKNLLDKDNITGAFLNSDDTGLTTNVFLNEPRLFGLRVTKSWRGGSTPSLFNARPDGSYPFTIELGGGVEKIDASSRPFAPSFTDGMSPTIDPVPIQNDDMDWSDSRDVKLTYRPTSRWRLSGAYRYGKANTAEHFEGRETVFHGCGLPSYPSICVNYPDPFILNVENYGVATVYRREEFAFADFSIGHDAGLGLLGANAVSSLEGGLRYVHLESTTRTQLRTDGGWTLDEAAPWSGYAPHTRGSGSIDADRKFDGVGPFLKWDAAKGILGAKDSGRLSIEWSVSGGAAVGEQKTRIVSSQKSDFYNSRYFMYVFYDPDPASTDAPPPTDALRSERKTALTYGASLGLAYDVRNVKVGAGYRIDTVKDALDAGVDARDEQDRTVSGPYFRISIGFGG